MPEHTHHIECPFCGEHDPAMRLLLAVHLLTEATELLAAHDAEVARQAEARALREAADQLTEIADDYDTCSELHAALRECDLDTAHWLRARADRVADTTDTEGQD